MYRASLFACIFLFLGAACGTENSNSGVNDDSCQYANDGECDEPQFCEVGTDSTDCGGGGGGGGGTINGMPAEDFYNQLLYQIDPNDTFPHSYLSQTSGDSNVGLWLFASGEFYVTYLSDGVERFESGAWRVEVTTLVLGDVGSASGFNSNDRPAARVTFSASGPVSELSGNGITLEMVSGTSSLSSHIGRSNDGTCDADLGEICGRSSETDFC